MQALASGAEVLDGKRLSSGVSKAELKNWIEGLDK